MDTQGSVTHIAAIFKFGDVSGPWAKKWPKVNRRLKIVNYFTCMRHFSCRWYRAPEVDLNGYPRICNPYCRRYSNSEMWVDPELNKWPKVNRTIKNSKLFYTCMRHFSCRWYTPPEVDLNGYPRICNPYCCEIFKFGDVSGPWAKKWPKVNRRIKNSKLFYMYAALLL